MYTHTCICKHINMYMSIYMYLCTYAIKFLVQENLYKLISKDIIGNERRGTQIK